MIILGALTVGSLVIVVLSSQTLQKTKGDLNQERYTRMVAEEKFEQAMIKIKSLEANLTAASNQLQSTKDALVQEKVNSTSVRDELEKMTKLKEVLEQELKNSLVTTSSLPPSQGQR